MIPAAPFWHAPTRSVPRETLTLAAGVGRAPTSCRPGPVRTSHPRTEARTSPRPLQRVRPSRAPGSQGQRTLRSVFRRSGPSRPGRSPTLIADPLTAGGPVEDEPSRRPGARPRRPDPEHCRSPGRERRGILPEGLSDAGEERPEGRAGIGDHHDIDAEHHDDRDVRGVQRARAVGLAAKDREPDDAGREINVHDWPERPVCHEGRGCLVEACLATRSAPRRRVLLRRLRGCTCGAVDQGASGHADGEGAQQASHLGHVVEEGTGGLDR